MEESSQVIFSQKCPKHPKQIQQFIHISDATGNPLICILCIHEKGIQSFNEVITISELAEDDQIIFQSNFPPLNDQSLYEKLKKMSQQKRKGGREGESIFQTIEEFFTNLQEEIEQAINVAKTEAKKKFIQSFQFQNDFQEIYQKKCFTKELKEALLLEGEQVSSKISEILMKAQSQKDETTQFLKEFLEQKSMSFEVPALIKEIIIKQIEKINFFVQSHSLLQQANLIKSNIGSSSNLSITKNPEGMLIAKADNVLGHKVAYCDFILNPCKRYVFRVQLQMTKEAPDNFLLFGLIPDSCKDSRSIYLLKMSYCQRDNEYGLGKVVKGTQLHFPNENSIDRQFEMRIYLSNQYIRVSDYPNYSTVCELDDPNKIEANIQYRFALESYYQSTITITDILEVPEFDEKM